ncbi:MAG: GerMN domain-containing protein [Vicinamibacteria bacterium]
MTQGRPVAPGASTPPAGFPRWAWWTLFLATFMFAVPLTSPWWSTFLRGEIPGAEDEGDAEAPLAASPAVATPEPVVPGSMLKVTLHMRLPDMPGLGTVVREVPYVRGIIPQIVAAVSELAVGKSDAPALLPEGTRVLDVAYTKSGTVYIDFSPELEKSRGVGAEEEKVVIEGIVDTISDNFTAARRIVILVDGKAPRPGHFDLSRALRHDDPVFAAEPDADPATLPAPGPVASATPARAQPKPTEPPPATRPTATPTSIKSTELRKEGHPPLS